MPLILHLSDLHIGKLLTAQIKPGHSSSAHRFIDSSNDEPNPETLADILKKDFDSGHPNIVVVSGDLGWSGDKEDYEYCLRFFQSLKGEWKTTAFVFAPGNHDVILSRRENRQEYYLRLLRRFYGANFNKYYPFLEAPYKNIDPSMLVGVHDITIPTDIGNKERVLIITANSAAYIEKDGTPVYIPPKVLKAIGNHIPKIELPSEAIRIFVIHHHLFPFAEPEWRNVRDSRNVPDKPDPTIVANSAKLQAWLSKNLFRLVLHGHKHIPHGREDKLWRRNDPFAGHHLVVIGAGSAGVEQSHRSHQEPLSFNRVTLSRLSKNRWRADVNVRQVLEDEAVPVASEFYKYSAEVGTPISATPHTFYAEFVDECHRLIRESTKGKGLLRNFISIVENVEYRHPFTTQIGERTVTQAEVENSFHTLHPEYEPSQKWTDQKKLEDILKNLNPRFQFQHGPRLFGIRDRQRLGYQIGFSPITRAIENLKLAARSHSYVGLYNPELDARGEQDEPLPGLMSIQFVADEDDKYLDVVVTFRKVELSFWWVVNMFEVSQILEWAAGRDIAIRRKPRRITFFAALAEWKENPEPAFVARLDQMSVGDLMSLLLNTESRGRKTAITKLRELLIEKLQMTNENNLDVTGLKSLADLLDGLEKRSRRPERSLLFGAFKTKIKESLEHTLKAVEAPVEERAASTQKAYKALEVAVTSLSNE